MGKNALNKYIGQQLEMGEFIYTITAVAEGAGGLYFDCDRYSRATNKTGKVVQLHESSLFDVSNVERNGKIIRNAQPLFRVLE